MLKNLPFFKDISPPILTFLSPIDNPWFNNGTLELSWTYNEEAVSRCQLLTSVYLLVVNCSNNSVYFGSLQPGLYMLYIQAEDRAGNSAQEVIVRWTVGEFIFSVYIYCTYTIALSVSSSGGTCIMK